MPLNYATLQDDELLILLRERDQVAFAEVYRRYFSTLYLHAYKMLDNKSQAQDIIQELFVAFWQKSSQLEIQTNLRAYLYGATRNRVLTTIKKNKINRDFLQMVADVIQEEDNGTMEQISEHELNLLINKEIDKLPPRMKQVFELSRKAYMSNSEIAALLGTSEETVKKQIHKSLAILKAKLGRYAGLAMVLMPLAGHQQYLH